MYAIFFCCCLFRHSFYALYLWLIYSSCFVFMAAWSVPHYYFSGSIVSTAWLCGSSTAAVIVVLAIDVTFAWLLFYQKYTVQRVPNRQSHHYIAFGNYHWCGHRIMHGWCAWNSTPFSHSHLIVEFDWRIAIIIVFAVKQQSLSVLYPPSSPSPILSSIFPHPLRWLSGSSLMHHWFKSQFEPI